MIGKGGQIVKQIREDTNSKVRVVEGVPNCEDRVIVISSRDTDPAIETNSAQASMLCGHPVVGLLEAGRERSCQQLIICICINGL